MYARPPVSVNRCDDLKIQELQFYQYLPVKMPGVSELRLEPRHAALKPLVQMLEFVDWLHQCTANRLYMYLTLKHGWATSENPLNRPGWHVDAWGHPEDTNYVWCDRFPTEYLVGELAGPMSNDEEALALFEDWGTRAREGNTEVDGVSSVSLHTVTAFCLYEFGQNVVHSTPVILEPGLRSFVKISVSPHKYNLIGNSVSPYFLEEYASWDWYDRAALRNDPVGGNLDYALVADKLGKET